MIDIAETADVFKALGDPTRLKIVMMLSSEGRMLCVNAIARELGISPSAVSQHLKILKQTKLVKGERMGYHVHYSIEKEKIRNFYGSLLNTLE